MTAPTPSPIPQPPAHCGHGADLADGAEGCDAPVLPGHEACLAHLGTTALTAYLSTLRPGADIDARGVTFTPKLLNDVLDAVRDPATGAPHLGDAKFENATFTESALFIGAMITGWARFDQATFAGGASFMGAVFRSNARFGQVTFEGGGDFTGTTFEDQVSFGEATFNYWASFDQATFKGEIVDFGKAIFKGDARFRGAQFTRSGNCTWHFGQARFDTARGLGPLACSGRLSLDHAEFAAPVTVEVAAERMSCVGTRFDGPATLRLSYAEVDLSEAVLAHPVTVISNDRHRGPVPADLTNRPETTVSLLSLRRVDAALLVLTDVDLRRCVFSGAHHLDQLRLEGECLFDAPPKGVRWGLRPVRWTRRQVLAEEHHWRAQTGRYTAREGWTPHSQASDNAPPGPAALVVVYRQLRKAFEDGKNEPGAADFYYGEMEMRRRDRRRDGRGTARTERWLLHMYWALSGYGLRASRAFCWLTVMAAATVLALMLWGLPNSDPKPQVTGTQAKTGHEVALIVDTPDPVLNGSIADRFSWKRTEKAVRLVVNSVVFRSSGQDLTPWGIYIEMLSRLLGALLLALAVLAIRGRVKR
ncbi:pentapeptide repeat-containing protein [Streptomyces sp. NPDC001165]|uniref:pentapeptide repeat-containing protein n=1 Tax=Streptomyces sp. NPDC001165 TaxID=3364546 RepID=UPI0036BF88BD